MKAIIIAGVGLFGAATIYGITDYVADKKKGTIDKLYKEETAAPASIDKSATAVPAEATFIPASAGNNTVTAVTKTSVKKKARKTRTAEMRFIKLDDFSRGRIPRREIKMEEPSGTAEENKKEE